MCISDYGGENEKGRTEKTIGRKNNDTAMVTDLGKQQRII